MTSVTLSPVSLSIIVGLFGIVGGLMAFYLRAWLNERTMLRKPEDQFVTLGTMEQYCEKKHGKIADSMDKERDTLKGIFDLELDHLKELVQKDFDHGKERFDTLDKKIAAVAEVQVTQGKAIVSIAANVKTIAGAVNGGVTIQD